MSDANKAVVQRFYDVFNSGKLNELDSFVRENFIDHNPLPEQNPGLAGLKQVMAMFRTAFPDIKIDVRELMAEGDKVAVRTQATGTHEGPLLGLPATGKSATISAIDIFVVKDGKIAEAWHVEELLYLLVQMGAVPMPGG